MLTAPASEAPSASTHAAAPDWVTSGPADGASPTLASGPGEAIRAWACVHETVLGVGGVADLDVRPTRDRPTRPCSPPAGSPRGRCCCCAVGPRQPPADGQQGHDRGRGADQRPAPPAQGDDVVVPVAVVGLAGEDDDVVRLLDRVDGVGVAEAELVEQLVVARASRRRPARATPRCAGRGPQASGRGRARSAAGCAPRLHGVAGRVDVDVGLGATICGSRRRRRPGRSRRGSVGCWGSMRSPGRVVRSGFRAEC